MFEIHPMSRQPIYEQLIQQVERYILTGMLAEGEQLPSVRSLSLSLSVNPNTVQKAFSELEARGITVSAPGRGSFVARGAVECLRRQQIGTEGALAATFRELRDVGIGESELISLVRTIYRETEEGNE